MTDPTPPTPENGAELLDAIEAHHRRFNAFPSEHAYVAVVLWDAHTHLIDCFGTTPRLAFLSPEPQSGKTRALEIIQTLTPRPLVTNDISPSALFRSVSSDSAGRPTILWDEVDAIFGPKAAGNEELRGLINSGYRRTGGVIRSVREGDNHKIVKFPVYAALALAGLGGLPDTIMSRSIVIRMRRRAPNETVESFRERINEPEGHVLRDRLADWAESVREQVDGAWPEMPDGIADRPADVWEPLLAVADAAGGAWPARARAACVHLVKAAQGDDSSSIGIRLLTDLRTIFGTAERLLSTALVEQLNDLDDAPWADLDGRPLTTRALSQMLGEYVTPAGKAIKPRNIRTGPKTVLKGYYAEDLADAWLRYCPPLSEESATPATSATPQVRALFSVAAEVAVAATSPAPATGTPAEFTTVG
ncbi:hypothetical protein F4556_003399 [Kitasatospora gansuensis]|uniref:DUF3631 domain-containing protein n=1 Tax=Kitasatospora gansuensis TaxID=258050 RepID=A0A7W7WIS7_9ACTN|nr:DUF3631 domain-containing protein [Kitasatospora gansuensis]MBB4947864.1 hypothetical protein [Kitasatospora gansuensis]